MDQARSQTGKPDAAGKEAVEKQLALLNGGARPATARPTTICCLKGLTPPKIAPNTALGAAVVSVRGSAKEGAPSRLVIGGGCGRFVSVAAAPLYFFLCGFWRRNDLVFIELLSLAWGVGAVNRLLSAART
eukprot:1186835-Prorocentrum_minimum.AAC.4